MHGGLVRKYAQKYDIPESEILDFSASLNPFGTPFEHPDIGLDLQNILDSALKDIKNYPDNRYVEFREAAARFLGMGVSAENIIPGNGSTEIVRLVAECVLDKDDIVILPQPTFSEYEMQCRITGASFQYIKQEDILDISDEVLAPAKMIFVCNPNNPTGRLLSREELEILVERCVRNETILFVDEAFIELADPQQTIVDIAISNDYVFVMRSLTKSFAIPGIRMGFGVASGAMADALNTVRLSWNLGSVADVTATALLNMEGGCYSSYLVRSRELIQEEYEFLMDRLSRIYGLEPKPSTVNYILVDMSGLLLDSSELAERMASHGILIRDCSSFHSLGNDYIRLAIRTREENERMVLTIGEVLTESAQEHAKEELKQNIEKSVMPASRNTCEYYPCHSAGQDCTFCFCPFYACEDERTGGKWIESSSGGMVWSCQECRLIHKGDVTEQVLDFLMDEGDTDENLKKAWKKVMEPLL